MPQTTDALRNLMHKWFGFEADSEAWLFLASHGFTQNRWVISPPVPAHNISYTEWLCIRYLVEEWDWAFAGSQHSFDLGE